MSHCPVKNPTENGEMANGPPNLTNPTLGVITPENMIQQINELILENNELKEAMRQNNQAMKGRFEELSVWRGKQMEERELYESKFRAAQQRLCEVSSENEQLKRDLQSQKEREEAREELEQLKAQVMRLQAEKADLLAIISELQIKVNMGSSEDSFVEIRIAKREENDASKANNDTPEQTTSELEAYISKSSDETKNYLESEEATVSRLLQSLREESVKVEKLEEELRIAQHRLAEVEEKAAAVSEDGTQTEENVEKKLEEDSTTAEFVSEVESLKLQIKSLCKELQEAHVKLNEAERLKKRLQEKCQALDQKLSEHDAELGEKQQLQFSVRKLELQVESMGEEIRIEKAKTENEMLQSIKLQDAFDKLTLEQADARQTIEDLRSKESARVQVVANELNEKLEKAERALAEKQLEIDKLKLMCKSQEEERETISLLRTQLEIYCSDFHAEREAREKIHGEKEQLAIQLEFMLKENARIQQDLDCHVRESLAEMQWRHGATGQSNQERSPRLVQRGADTTEAQHNIPMHACPKCNEILPDLDTLQIHVMDCIT
ncbi:optineurin [Rhinatrema bivittatum]|uniref:optineurin n=1 Tax=Rhinatrema bivittatum TaxID=194408 RepID=UPI0011296324|nr:optineurin [Rhinatrema bivittatum]XP_029471231.1 optineurin [Rhinatrema bivittatum]